MKKQNIVKKNKTPKYLVSWSDFDKAAQKIYKNFRNNNYDSIIGISRGGLPLAITLSHKFEKVKNFGILDISKTGTDKIKANCLEKKAIVRNEILNLKNGYHILLVDDIVSYGDTLEKAKSYLHSRYQNLKIDSAAILIVKSHLKKASRKINFVNYYWKEKPEKPWAIFPWE